MKKLLFILTSILFVQSAQSQIDLHVYVFPDYGSCTGEVELRACGTGTLTYNIQLDGNPVSISALDNMCSGSHTLNVTISDGASNLYSFTSTVNLTPGMVSMVYSFSSPLNPLTAIVEYVSASSGCNGSASVSLSDGQPAYSIQWYDNAGNAVPGGTTNTYANLCPGNYGILVYDTYAPATCTGITQPVTKVMPALMCMLSTTDETCYGACDGTSVMTAFGTGGQNIVNAVQVGPSSTGGNFITGQCAGVVTGYATDATGATTYCMDQIAGPSQITIAIDTTTADLNNDGTVEYTITGGTSPYNVVYIDSNQDTLPANDSTITGLSAGTYTLLVTDDNGCMNTEGFTIDQFSGMNENIDFNARVYPNPFTNLFVIEGKGLDRATLFSIDGKQILLTETYAQSKIQIDASALPSGTYFVKIASVNGNLQVYKIVKL